MIIWLDDALFAGPGRALDRAALLRNAARRRHTLIISTRPDAPWGARECPAYDAWIAALPAALQAEFALLRERLAIVSVTAVTLGAERLLVCERDPGPEHKGARLSIDDAVRALSLPLHVMVEHQINDAAFLRVVMPPAWRARIERWERSGELRFVHGGGLPVMAELVSFHCNDDNCRLAFGLPAALWRLTHFVVFDHDGERPEDPGRASAELGRVCAGKGLQGRWHRLSRRDQEHYLPLAALRAMVEKITDPGSREQLLSSLDAFGTQGEERHFLPLPQLGERELFKNAFKTAGLDWQEDWFEADGAWPEMIRLAERIASAI